MLPQTGEALSRSGQIFETKNVEMPTSSGNCTFRHAFFLCAFLVLAKLLFKMRLRS